jgi:hypothetical protein
VRRRGGKVPNEVGTGRDQEWYSTGPKVESDRPTRRVTTSLITCHLMRGVHSTFCMCCLQAMCVTLDLKLETENILS